MNEIINKFLSAGNKFMPKTHLGGPGFMYSTCRIFANTKKGYKNLKKQEIQDIFI